MHFSVFYPKPKKPTQAPDVVVTKAARVGYLTNFSPAVAPAHAPRSGRMGVL